MSKADLHIHSRFSDRSAEWIARRFDFPDSYSQPHELYDALKTRGMEFVTITDHNRIEGCLEIAHKPDVFISEEISAYFPEDRAQVHLLVWNINETQHREMQALRNNIYDLQKYLAQHGLAHAVAHPFYKVDDKLTLAHFEKLTLLFKTFEGINGLRDALFSEIAQFVFTKLTPEKIDEFANRQNLAPTHDEPWKKILTAGSDDHGGIFPASAFTETADAKSASDFLAKVQRGECSIHGKGGTPLSLSHGLYNTAFAFAKEKFSRGNRQSFGLLEKVFSRFMEGRDPTEFSFLEKMGFLAQGIASGKIFELAKPANASLWKQMSGYFKETDVKRLLAEQTAGIDEPERRAFITANFFANQLAFRYFTKFVKELSSGNFIESIQDISTLIPILLPLSPYIYSFRSQAPQRDWLAGACRSVAGEIPPSLQNNKRAWFTDTLEDVNGVATTIRKMTLAGVANGGDLTVVTSRTKIEITDIPIKNFQPIGEFELPEYELQKLSFPPILEMLDYIQREKFSELIISTPGPVGITALIAAKMLGLRTSGIYHTDFPQYIRILTDDSFLETLTWDYMHWFYTQLDLIFVNSEHYRRAWMDRGISANKLAILPRGLDTLLFDPAKRDRAFLKKYGVRDGSTVLLYVGRISKEKDLDVLAAAYKKLRDEKKNVQLVLVGDGPYLKELKTQLPDACSTGYLAGLELAKAYASADIFCFPSTTDTFGNVVIESLASGVPCVVSDQGGPRELIRDGVTGFITKSLDVEDFTAAVRRIVDDEKLLATMRVNARKAVQDRDWSEAFKKFWAMSPSD
jgi:glycosyltransferase involved in cell wall biosynthesis/predicted metal-dependent phosphoesterase TrpH